MAELKTNAMRILEKAKIPYKMHTYDTSGGIDAISVAGKIDHPVDQVYKTLVTQGKSRDYFVFVIPATAELNLKKAAKAVDEKSVEMIHVKDINKVTGYIRGGCSPIGMKKSYRTVVSETAEKLPTFIISAGRIGYQIEMNPQALVEMIHGSFYDIIME